ncbi:MAG TPA: hypothetical protein VG675_05460 [Bryobacteraceae bacterium]|nr:hypothetical protein [Bryobacteraceae bacterium]
MEIRIQLPQTSYVTGEEIQVDVTVRNTGSEAVTLPLLNDPYGPQPYFVISGPSFPKPHRFYWGGKPPSGSQPPRQTRSIAPGQALSSRLSLPPNLVFRNPGAHELYATYEWNGTVFESNRVTVTMEAPGPPLFRVVGRTPLSSEVSIQALSVNGSGLYLATFIEDRPDIGETEFGGITRLATIDAGATDFFAPWCQTAQAGVIGPRFGWRTGNAITVAGFRKLPQRLDLPFTPRIYGPSLMGANGDIDLLVTSDAGTKLSLLRFPNVAYNQQPPPARLVWTSGVQTPISNLAATINPSGARFAVLRQGGAISLVTWDDSGPHIQPPLPFDGNPVDAVAPALHASMSGVVRASVLTADPANPRRVSLTEFTWRPNAAPETKAGAPFDLPSGIHSGTVAYSMSAVESPRRDWFFVLDDHRVESSLSGGKARPTKRVVSLPPQLLVMSQVTYCMAYYEKPLLVTIQ